MTEAELDAFLKEMFFSYQTAKMAKAKKESRQFVHYTRIENVLSLIENKEIWLRNSSVMNDYSEIRHGESDARRSLRGELADFH